MADKKTGQKRYTQESIFDLVAYRLRTMGRLLDSLAPASPAVRSYDTQHDAFRAAEAARNLTHIHFTIGNLSDALASAKAAVEFADESTNVVKRVVNRGHLAAALHALGHFREAQQVFEVADYILAEFKPDYSQIVLDGGQLRHCELLLDFRDCERIESRLQLDIDWMTNHPDYGPDPNQEAYASVLLGEAFVLKSVDKATREFSSTAAQYFETAVQRFRDSRHLDYLPRGLLGRARSMHMIKEMDKAREDLNEAWDIASRGPMRLHMADIHVSRARLFFCEKAYPWKSPQDDSAGAEKLIDECGYHRRDEELAGAKRVILG